jgi:single-strand DNA-binding protein
MNCITLTGRAGRDPEVRYLESGTMVANFTLAVNRMKRDEDPDWFNLEIWGKQAQVAADYVRKGSLIGVIGSVRNESWTDRTTGEKRSKVVIRVDRLELMGSKKDSEQESGEWAPPESPAAAPAPAQQQGPARQSAPATPAPSQTWHSAGPASDEEVPF